MSTCRCGALCPSCDAKYSPDSGAICHDDDCAYLAALRRADEPCTAAATGFCHCSRHAGVIA